MQIEIYNMIPVGENIYISLEAVCDSFSSLLWDIEYYKCGAFEVYIAASPRNIEIFQTGRIVGRDDDKEHFGLIESVELETDSEDGDYLIVKGRFLMCLLERRIIYPTLNFTSQTSYGAIVQKAVENNALASGNRLIPGLELGKIQGACWNAETKLQVSYDNLMEWVYTICEKIGGTANIRLSKPDNEQYEMVFELSQGTDRSTLQKINPHIIFSDRYNNLLSLTYFTDASVKKNYAYVLGKGEGEKRKRTIYFEGTEPSSLERYEVYVDAKDISDKGNTQDKVDTGAYRFYVRSPIIEHSDSYLFDEEAVITVGDGVGTGKVFHYVKGKYNLHQRCYRMYDFRGVTGKYFYYFFSTNFYRRVKSMSAKTSVDSVRMEMITKMKISVPCLAEQQKIADCLSSLDEVIEKQKATLAAWEELKKGLLQQMFV